MDTNAAGSSAAGASEDKIALIKQWRESDLFSPSERSALAFAEGMTQTPADVPEDVFAEARRHFSDPQLAELAATVAMENYRARFNRAFLVESQHFYAPHRDPLPPWRLLRTSSPRPPWSLSRPATHRAGSTRSCRAPRAYGARTRALRNTLSASTHCRSRSKSCSRAMDQRRPSPL
jgi:hypothetical protein